MNYVQEVADLFLTSCPNVTILSPTDFAIIAEWEKQDIPLAVILNSINEVCAEPDQAGCPISSVNDIQDRVRQDFFSWLLQAKENQTS